MEKKSIYKCLLLLCMAILSASCQEDTEHFDNKVITGNSTEKVGTYLLKPGTDELIKSFQAQVPQPAQSEIKVTYKGDSTLVEQYNAIYRASATALPKENYEFIDSTAIIKTGNVLSTDVTIRFKNLTSLDGDLIYVLPVTVEQANWELLESTRTSYYVFKGAALINTVANVRDRRLRTSLANPSVLNNITKITVEALIYPDELQDKISTLMGIEGKFLLRFSDNGLPGNQMQVATARTNATNSRWTVEMGKWSHIAITYDSDSGDTEMFVNGESRGKGDRYIYYVTINWGVSYSREEETNSRRGFWVGYSYDTPRYLSSDISECRISNRILSIDELNEKNHFYYVNPKSNGLVAYWKFDEGQGTTITDYANGNNLIANKELTWKALELPAKNK